MDKNIEVEVRGPLNKENFDKLKQLFESEGTFVTRKERILIDYSTFLEGGIENRSKDIRLRVTNGIPEIIVKMGEWGENEHREELSVTTQPETFDTLVRIFALLGYTKGVLCVRKSLVYAYHDIEFALVEVPNHSYYFEAEKMSTKDKNTIDTTTQEINHTCKQLGLDIFTKEQFFQYIHTLNKEANEVFDANTVANPHYFREKFHITNPLTNKPPTP